MANQFRIVHHLLHLLRYDSKRKPNYLHRLFHSIWGIQSSFGDLIVFTANNAATNIKRPLINIPPQTRRCTKTTVVAVHNFPEFSFVAQIHWGWHFSVSRWLDEERRGIWTHNDDNSGSSSQIRTMLSPYIFPIDAFASSEVVQVGHWTHRHNITM